jgi:hypothetical protein
MRLQLVNITRSEEYTTLRLIINDMMHTDSIDHTYAHSIIIMKYIPSRGPPFHDQYTPERVQRGSVITYI